MKPLHIAVVAGELSGDRLGGPLITALRARFPDARFSGVGGEAMQQAGLTSLGNIKTLSVMGFAEVLGSLRGILRLKNHLLTTWAQDKPDIFIGIDAPDFNLRLAKTLHQQGVKTVQYVSPSLWAWKEKRITKIQAAIDLVLCLFPFETAVYERHNVAAVCVGHPMKDRIKALDKATARRQLFWPRDWEASPVLGIFPGSRKGEIKRLLPLFLQVFQQLRLAHPELKGVVSISGEQHQAQIESELKTLDLPHDILRTSERNSELLMSASDALLLASGTITLEAALLARPMSVAYRVHPLSAAIARRLLKIDHFSLPNLLAGKEIVHEWIQETATVENIAGDCTSLLFDSARQAQQIADLRAVTEKLPVDVSAQAASAVAALMEKPR